MNRIIQLIAIHSIVILVCNAQSNDTTYFAGVGTHFGQFFFRTDMDSASMEVQLDLVQAAGFNAIRDECYWSEVEKERGVYSFPKQIDNYILAAQKRGIKVLLILNYNNPLYAPHAGAQMITDSNRTAYVKYCAEVVKRYSPLGVKHYEFWNEPNLPMFWDPTPNASDYVKMIKIAYPAIKKIDSSVTLIGCATSPLEGQSAPNIPWTNFISKVVQDSGMYFMDAVSFHQYRVDKAPELWLNADLQTIVLLTGSSKPIWLTEVGYHTSSLWPYTTLSMQADYVTRMYLLGMAIPSLKRISYYDFKNDGTLANNAEHNYGIVNYDRTTKPAYVALKTLFGVVQKKIFKNLSITQNNYTASFGETGSKVFALWNSITTTQQNISFGTQSCYLVESDGKRKLFITKDGVLSVTMASSPQYIVQVPVLPKLKSFRIEPKTLSIDTSQSFIFKLRGEDSLSNPTEISAGLCNWKVIGNIGSVDSTGKFRPSNSGSGNIVVTFNGLSDTASINVFIPTGSMKMNDFANDSEWNLSVSNLDLVHTLFTMSTEQASYGSTSGKLNYQFKHKNGLGILSYIALLQTEISVPGNPDSVVVDIFGNGSPHQLEFQFRDLYGEYFSRFSADQPIMWNNVWRPVTIWMRGFGANIDYPITLNRIIVYIVPTVLVADSTYSGSIYLDNLRAKFNSVASVNNNQNHPTQFQLFQNYPNPFNPSTKIQYDISTNSFVSLTVFDILGKEVRSVVNEYQQPGSYSVEFSDDRNTLSSGLYFYRLSSGNYTSIRKMVYLK